MTIARIMKVCASSRAWRISVVCLVFALLLGTGVQIFAGEPIVFGNSKRQTEPNSEKVPARNPFGFEKLSAPVPFEGILPPVLPSLPSNARKDKRQQNADDENRNWMFLEKGELQKEDDEKNFLGVRDDKENLDLDKGNDRKDYTFRESSSSRRSTQGHVPGSRPNADAKQQRPVREDDSEAKRPARTSAIVFGNGSSQAARNAGSELDTQTLVGTKAETELGDKASLRDFLSGTPTTPNREQQRRTESFKQLLALPAAGGLSDSLNLRPELARQPSSLAGNSSPLGSFGPKQSFGNDLLGPRTSTLLPNNSGNGLGSPDLLPRPSFGIGPSQPASPGAWKPTEVPWPKRY